MREAAELAWQRPSGLGVREGTRAVGMRAWARAGKLPSTGHLLHGQPCRGSKVDTW